MAYKTLYRKYRPTRFQDVCGQQYIVTTLCNAIENDKISHAYLFTGTRGTGKTTIAKIFAKMVNCLDIKDNKPCGVCEVCKCENTDEIPDIIEIDAASNNGVDEIRELKNKIKLMPVMCKYKVYIIDEVHMLSTGAFNALLKTLEEPPSHVIFILATTEPQKLPITIISRCQRFDFKKISIDDIYIRLKYISEKENIKISFEALNEIAIMSDGALRDAIGLLDQLSSYNEDIEIDDIYMLKGSVSKEELMNLATFYINRDMENMLNLIEKIYNDGKSFHLLAEDMLILFRNILICKKARKYFENKELANKKQIEELSTKISNNSIETIIDKLENLTKNIKDSSYSRVLFEVGLLSDFNEEQVVIEEKPIEISEKVIEEDNKEEKINIIKEVTTVTKPVSNKNILINNTIAEASLQNKKKVKEAFIELDNYLINKKFKTAATILKDATIQAASDDHLLLTYKYSSMVEDHEENKNIIELINKILKTSYKIVAITEDEWKTERPRYLELKKSGNLKIIEENENTENVTIEKEIIIDGYTDIFGSELIEMEG